MLCIYSGSVSACECRQEYCLSTWGMLCIAESMCVRDVPSWMFAFTTANGTPVWPPVINDCMSELFWADFLGDLHCKRNTFLTCDQYWELVVSCGLVVTSIYGGQGCTCSVFALKVSKWPYECAYSPRGHWEMSEWTDYRGVTELGWTGGKENDELHTTEGHLGLVADTSNMCRVLCVTSLCMCCKVIKHSTSRC